MFEIDEKEYGYIYSKLSKLDIGKSLIAKEKVLNLIREGTN
jgi:hypothetical protein